MPSLTDLLASITGQRSAAPAQPQQPEFDPNRPWDAPALQTQAAPSPAPSPSPSPYSYAQPDPYGLAQHLAQRQQAAAQLGAPAAPALEVPQLPKSLVDHIMEWFKKQDKK